MDLAGALKEFNEHGYTVIPDALAATQVDALVRALDDLTSSEPHRIHNIADVIGLRDEFLDLIDLPTVLPIVRELLGDNIWVNQSHYNVNPPDARLKAYERKSGYGWHRDGGAINQDLPMPAPLLSVKVAFYLSDLTMPARGQTYVIEGSHQGIERPPLNEALPEVAKPVCVKPGSALLFDRRLIHSIRSENRSDITRKAIFIQYAFRWMSPVDSMTVEHLHDRCDPVRLQLLGLGQSYRQVDGAIGRSAKYFPGPKDIPLAGEKTRILIDILGSIRRRLRRFLGPR